VPKPQRTDTAFGAGCFALTPNRSGKFSFTGKEYLADARETLAFVQGVDHITAAAGPWFEGNSYELHGPLPSIDAGPTVFPAGSSDLFIAFTVHILRRVQAELMKETRSSTPHDASEAFNVFMTTGYLGPVAFVEPIDPSASQEPSQAVILVREYLRRELGHNAKAPLKFECLGPSPFHADFYLKAFRADGSNEANRPGTYAVQSHMLGYEEVTITYNPASYPSLTEAFLTVHSQLAEELCLAYYAIQQNLRLYRAWNTVAHEVRQLSTLHEARGIRPLLNRTFQVPHQILHATLALTNYELDEIESINEVRDALRETYEQQMPPIVKGQVEQYVAELQPRPTEQLRQLISLFDRYRAERLASINVLISAIVGGIVGAVLTAVATRLVTGH
jgi:hypothetical protein